MPEKNSTGKRIKNLMEIKNISRETLSKNSGVNIDILEKIENGEIIPSLTPLTKLARALGVRLGTFLDDEAKNDPLVTRKGESQKVIRFSGEEGVTEDSTLEFYSLGAGKIDRHMEPFIIDIHSEKKEFELSSHEGEEFIYVLKGQIELIYGNQKVILNSGDSLYYDSVVPHHLHSYDGKGALILAVIYTPF